MDVKLLKKQSLLMEYIHQLASSTKKYAPRNLGNSTLMGSKKNWQK